MTAPQPSLKARAMTFRFVPGGPEPMTNGLGSLRPSTVVASVAIGLSLLCGFRRQHSHGRQSHATVFPHEHFPESPTHHCRVEGAALADRRRKRRAACGVHAGLGEDAGVAAEENGGTA